MAVRRDTEPWLRERDPVPDLGFRIAFGSYVGIVALEGLFAGARWAGFSDEGVLALAGMATFAVAGLAGGVAVGFWRHGPERIGRSRLRHGFVFPGLLVITPEGIARLVDVGDIVSLPLLFASLAATFFGGIVAMMVRTRYVTALTATSTPVVSWDGNRSRRSRLRASLFVLPPAVGIVALEPEVLSSVIVGVVSGFVGSLAETSQTVSVHDAGLSVRKDFNRQLFPWDQFDGYRLTDKELLLERSIRPDIGWRRSDIEDIEAVTDTLDEQLGD